MDINSFVIGYQRGRASGGSTGGSGLPPVTEEDNGKILRVVDGAWAVVDLPIYDGENEVM